MPTKPTYLNIKAVATAINMNPDTAHTITRRYRHHETNPIPPADAYILLGSFTIPVWLKTTLPAWRAWKERRDAATAAAQAIERINAAKKTTPDQPTEIDV